jgi:hypothetical protein
MVGVDVDVDTDALHIIVTGSFFELFALWKQIEVELNVYNFDVRTTTADQVEYSHIYIYNIDRLLYFYFTIQYCRVDAIHGPRCVTMP